MFSGERWRSNDGGSPHSNTNNFHNSLVRPTRSAVLSMRFDVRPLNPEGKTLQIVIWPIYWTETESREQIPVQVFSAASDKPTNIVALFFMALKYTRIYASL